MKKLVEGMRVIAPDKNEVLRPGVVVDILNVMCYIVFDNGTDNFVYLVDKRIETEGV